MKPDAVRGVWDKKSKWVLKLLSIVHDGAHSRSVILFTSGLATQVPALDEGGVRVRSAFSGRLSARRRLPQSHRITWMSKNNKPVAT